jgi:hypothetical protein
LTLLSKPHRIDHSFVVRLAKDGAARHKGIGPGVGHTANVVHLDAAVHFQPNVFAAGCDALTHASILRSAESIKLWPPKPGLTLMIRIRSMSSITQSSTSSGCAGLNTSPALHAFGLDRLNAAVHMAGRIRVKADEISTGIGKGGWP